MDITGKQLKTGVKDIDRTITVNGKEYKITLNFNVLCELEDVYGDIEKAMEDMQNFKIKAIRAVIYAIIKTEDDNENLTLKEVGKMLDMSFLNEFVKKMGVALNNDMPALKDDEEMGEQKPVTVPTDGIGAGSII